MFAIVSFVSDWLLYGAAILMGALGYGVLSAYRRSKRLALLLGGLAYLWGGIVAATLGRFWPLVAAFAVAWLVKVTMASRDSD